MFFKDWGNKDLEILPYRLLKTSVKKYKNNKFQHNSKLTYTHMQNRDRVCWMQENL